jgi:hypothetical protein
VALLEIGDDGHASRRQDRSPGGSGSPGAGGRIAQGKLIGLLRLDHERPDFFTPGDKEEGTRPRTRVPIH